MDEKIQLLINNLKNRNIEAFFAESLAEANNMLLRMIPEDCSVGIGNSATLKQSGISKLLAERGNTVYDKTMAETQEESRSLKKKALTADWYVTGSNAISLQGHIVNMDHSGNRVAAMLYGPDNVAVVIGVNKLADSLEEAIYRVRNVAAPKNARRAGFNPPCTELNQCIDCSSPERVCNSLVVIEGQADADRMKVIVVGEASGF
jgi:L-lactate utilization protein LutB